MMYIQDETKLPFGLASHQVTPRESMDSIAQQICAIVTKPFSTPTK